ncbi:MAG: flagellar export chaperone FliS [Ferrimicrobium sp.]|uniref:Flagellar export chaperone FliS n=1 Tax=Ferrimicrobium acidiphilum TaxID=121039 RepID=A0ABV3Y018_9ACTN|nr:flagellar export chaperone FliS [Ferrimicrobium sp.]MCL5974094.1 flagellar protein FliS [Actinomycetota bacterium]MDA8399664.1 flagellar protein FliS [Actinomycetota bacterium]
MAYSGRRSYAVNSVETASPSARLVMMVDLLDAALLRAERAYEVHDLYEIHCGLKNAQAIVALLRDSLQLDVWEGANDVHRLYEYSLDRLVRSNLYKERELLAEAEAVLRPLMNAWRQAAVLVGRDG